MSLAVGFLITLLSVVALQAVVLILRAWPVTLLRLKRRFQLRSRTQPLRRRIRRVNRTVLKRLRPRRNFSTSPPQRFHSSAAPYYFFCLRPSYGRLSGSYAAGR